jgi:SnoaL-like domain
VTAKRFQQGDQFMSKHVSISPTETADRLTIRELVEAYAHCADRRDAKGQMSLFTEDTHFVVFMNAKDRSPRRSCIRAKRLHRSLRT